jgi:formamidopyrimidine-DNA glycosylase
MPELPEVETIRRRLAPAVEGRRLLTLDVLDPRLTMPEPPESLGAELAGRRVKRLDRRGKYLIWVLDGGSHLVLHLRMTGSLLLVPEPDDRPGRAHLRARIELEDGTRVLFCDPRRFGTAVALHGEDALHEHLRLRAGVEPLSPEFTPDALHRMAAGRRAPVKSFLLDQQRIAGVGNIYADEALFRAGIHPLRPVGRLRRTQLAALRDAVVEALRAGLDGHGATLSDFRHPDGTRGSSQDSFLVHRREGLPCPRCGGPIVKLRAAGRGTYVCERCQPRPRARRSRPARVDLAAV